MNVNFLFLLIVIFVFTSRRSCTGQVQINGATCAMRGTAYQYDFSGPWSPTTTMQVCISGGTIQDVKTAGKCTANGAPLAALEIIWFKTAGASITVTTSQGNAVLNVSVTTPLHPGKIDSADQTQVIHAGEIPAKVKCTASRGGACSPAYTYQWQISVDAVSWVGIDGATSQNLSFSRTPEISSFYRRQVIETTSNNIAYSSLAVISVLPANP